MKKCICVLVGLVGLASAHGAQPSNENENLQDGAAQPVVVKSTASGPMVASPTPPNEGTNAGETPGLPEGIDEVDVEAVLQHILAGRGEDYDPTKPVGVRRLERALQEIAALLVEIRTGGVEPGVATAKPSIPVGDTRPAALGGSASGTKVPTVSGSPTDVVETSRGPAIPLAETVADHARRLQRIERELEAMKAAAVPTGAPERAVQPE